MVEGEVFTGYTVLRNDDTQLLRIPGDSTLGDSRSWRREMVSTVQTGDSPESRTETFTLTGEIPLKEDDVEPSRGQRVVGLESRKVVMCMYHGIRWVQLTVEEFVLDRCSVVVH